MSFRIRKAAVLGAGVMGSGIAAHLANAGIPVLLLDIVPPVGRPGREADSTARSATSSRTARWRTCARSSAGPADHRARALAHRGRQLRGRPRSASAECDWVVEVVKEDLALKHAAVRASSSRWSRRRPSSARTPRA